MSQVVLPAIRMHRFQNDLLKRFDRDAVDVIMALVEKHIETGAQRWGNACPFEGCNSELLRWTDGLGFKCPTHGVLGKMAPTQMLVAFEPILQPTL